MTAVRSGPTSGSAHATPAGVSPVSSAPPTGPVPTGRHARPGSGTPSGPLVPLRTVVRAPPAAPASAQDSAPAPASASAAASAAAAAAPAAAVAPAAALDLAAGRLVIDSSYCRLSPHLRARRVAVSVDGLPWRFAWGRTPIDLPAGRHLVEIEVEHGRAGRRAWGHAADAVPVCAGNTVEVFYRAPALPRLAGSLGPARQRTAGLALCAALGGLAVLAGLALLALAVLLVA